MAGLVNVTRNAESLKGFQIISSDDMYTALKYMSARNYSGHINCAIGGTWTLGLNGPNQTVAQTAYINDWIVIKNDTTAEVVPAAQAGSLYTVGP